MIHRGKGMRVTMYYNAPYRAPFCAEGRAVKTFRFAYVAFALSGAVLAGCQAGPSLEGAVLHVGNGAEVQNLDPHLVQGLTEHRVLSSLFEGLTDIDPKTMQPVPAAAESWTVSPDGRVYTFRLRKEARWSNGEPVTAHDFLYAWKRILSPNLAAEYAYMLHVLKNAKAFNEGKITDFGEVGAKALDDYTIETTLDNPTPYFLSMQMHFTWYPIHQRTVERFGVVDERNNPWTLEGNHVGNGPFRLMAWRPNDYILVARNPHYWNASAIRLDGIEYLPISNEQTEERVFRAGGLQLTQTVPSSKIPVYQVRQPDRLIIVPYCGTYYYRINITRPPFQDKRVRQAFALAINREELVRDVLKGGEAPAYNLVPPRTADYTFPSPFREDVEQARALLAEAGYPNGEGLPPAEILYNTTEGHKIIAEALQRMWKVNLNAEVRLMNQDWKVYLDSMNNLDYSMARSSWIADVLDPINFLECFISGGGNNRTGFASTVYDRLVEQARAANDPAARMALLQEAEVLLMDEMPILPIYFYTWKFLQAPEVMGLVPNALGYIRWADLYLDNSGGEG